MFFFGNIMSGGFAGATSLCFVYPLDFARTRLAADVGKGDSREFTGLVDCIQKIYSKGGFRGLYNGFGMSVVGIFAYRGSYFGLFDTGKAWIFKGDTKNANILAMWAFAQFVAVSAGVTSYPIDTVRRRLQMQAGRSELLYNGTWDCFVKIAQQEGYRAFFKGSLTNIFRATGGALVLVFYEKIQAWLGL